MTPIAGAAGLDPLSAFERRAAAIVPAPNNVPYLVAIVGMVALAIVAFVAIAIARPQQDLVVLGGIVFTATAPTTLALLGFMKAQETHLSVNSRLDAFIQNATLAARVQGLADGRAQGHVDANLRTDALATAAATALAANTLPAAPIGGTPA